MTQDIKVTVAISVPGGEESLGCSVLPDSEQSCRVVRGPGTSNEADHGGNFQVTVTVSIPRAAGPQSAKRTSADQRGITDISRAATTSRSCRCSQLNAVQPKDILETSFLAETSEKTASPVASALSSPSSRAPTRQSSVAGSAQPASEVGARVPRYSWGTPSSPIVRVRTRSPSVALVEPPATSATRSRSSRSDNSLTLHTTDGQPLGSGSGEGAKKDTDDKAAGETGIGEETNAQDDTSNKLGLEKNGEDENEQEAESGGDGTTESAEGSESGSESDDEGSDEDISSDDDSSEESSDEGGSEAQASDRENRIGDSSKEHFGEDGGSNNQSSHHEGSEEESSREDGEVDEDKKEQGSEDSNKKTTETDAVQSSELVRQGGLLARIPWHARPSSQLSSSTLSKSSTTPSPPAYIMSAPPPQLTGTLPDTPVINRRAAVLWDLARKRAAKDLDAAARRHSANTPELREAQERIYSELKYFRGRLLGMLKRGWTPDGPQGWDLVDST